MALSLIDTLRNNRNKKAEMIRYMRSQFKRGSRYTRLYRLECDHYDFFELARLTRPTITDLEFLKIDLELDLRTRNNYDYNDLPCGLQDHYYEVECQKREFLNEVIEAIEQLKNNSK
jgi:hypothetical protein